ncbi:hypothetical protein G9A89_007796 [Geosiphon pyriformis]|nr:hypothetical protein G9A89_007796 [Geosiphon pyriformis]
MSSLVWKMATCNIRGINNSAKQEDIIYWHKNMDNVISVVTETKLKSKFEDASLAAASKAADNFEYHRTKDNINGMWTLLYWVVCFAVEATLVKTWSKDNRLVKTAVSSRFHKLELLVTKILFVEFKSSLGNGYGKMLVEQSLACFRKLYKSCKFLDSKATKDSQIWAAIAKYIEAFVNNKDQIIRSVLEKPFRKVILDHLVDNEDLVLESDLVKNRIMMNFGLSKDYKVHDSLDQEEVFSPLLWRIFYDPLLYKVKKHESFFVYWVNSKFVARTSKIESNTDLISYLAAGAFVDDTI